jgi:hypothetical protein
MFYTKEQLFLKGARKSLIEIKEKIILKVKYHQNGRE